MIPRADWRAIKGRLRRTAAFTSRAADRKAIRETKAFLVASYPILFEHANLLPISSMQWSSVVIEHLGARIAFIDVEQANAISLLFLRSFWRERPIITEVDFLIRAAEVLYDDGDIVLAASMSERANVRLREYCERVKSGAIIPRPKFFDPRLTDILESQVILAFITGHELGHVAQLAGVQDGLPFMGWVAERFQELRLVPFPSARLLNLNGMRERFISPEIVQKFIDDGTPYGFASYGTKMATTFHTSANRLVCEVQADAAGVLAATDAAIKGGIEADLLFPLLINLLEHAEMLMILRRLLARLPRGAKRASIAYEGTNLGARLIHFVRLVQGIRNDEVAVPAGIADYWKTLPNERLAGVAAMEASGHLEQYGERASVVARGGVEVGLYGKLATHVPAETRQADLDLLAGASVIAEAHRGLDIEHYSAEAQYEWDANSEVDLFLAGFGAAIRDIADVSASEARPRNLISREDICRDGSDADFIEFLRSGRTQIFRMQLNPNWAEGFEGLLRSNL